MIKAQESNDAADETIEEQRMNTSSSLIINEQASERAEKETRKDYDSTGGGDPIDHHGRKHKRSKSRDRSESESLSRRKGRADRRGRSRKATKSRRYHSDYSDDDSSG
eukprot:CAMPEP_0197190936 /NCGR_PEP_ID=MMETSP1423-20130617/22507_1 /TAXON_ID=476441 /ORGANISM="Pseudo-nitzschia heimii, Strain UNC1101" /LENGTH=107 /DNA_ID=CAMNT_0042643423 /DNA_START=1 /DNA_END=322 /DNA_ORIENTATION=+